MGITMNAGHSMNVQASKDDHCSSENAPNICEDCKTQTLLLKSQSPQMPIVKFTSFTVDYSLFLFAVAQNKGPPKDIGHKTYERERHQRISVIASNNRLLI